MPVESVPKPIPSPTSQPVLSDLPFRLPELDQVGLTDSTQDAIRQTADQVRVAPKDPAKAGDLGMVLYNASCPMAAAKCFEYASSLDPKSVPWRYYLGLCQDDLYNAAEAIAAYESALALNPDYVPIMVRLAKLRLKSDLSGAKEIYAKALKINDHNPNVYFGLGECSRQGGDCDAAIPLYQKAIELAPYYSDARQALATCLEKLGKKDEAAAQRARFDKNALPVMADDPLYFNLLSHAAAGNQLAKLGEALAQSGQIGKAVAALEAAVQKDDNDLAAREELALLLDRIGGSREAVQHFRVILNRRPQDFDTALNLAWALMNIGEFAEAFQLGTDVLGSEPNNIRAMSVCGWAQLRSGRPKNAMIYFERLLKHLPNDRESNFAMAAALVCLLRGEDAVEPYRRAAAQQSAGREMMKEFIPCVLRVMMEQRRNAAIDKRAKASMPNCFEPLAVAFEAKEMASEAKAVRAYWDVLIDQSIAAARHGDHADALDYVRLALDEQGRRSDGEIILRLKKQVESEPKDPNVQQLWALVLQDIADSTGAKAQWSRIVAEAPTYTPAYLSWTVALVGENDMAGAKKVLEDGRKHISDSPLLDNALAWVLATASDPQTRDPARAVELARSAVQKAGERNPGMLDTLAVAYAAQGNFDEAVRYEQEAIKVARATTNRSSFNEYRERLKLFENKKPYVPTSGPSGSRAAATSRPS